LPISLLCSSTCRQKCYAPNHKQYFFFFHFSFILHMCIQGLVHFSPLPPPPPLPPTPPPPSPPPLNTQQKLFTNSTFVLSFVLTLTSHGLR
jgi:hypothetical protein